MRIFIKFLNKYKLQENCTSMSAIRDELLQAAYNRAYAQIDYNVYNNIHKRHEFKRQTVLADESLTKDEKSEVTLLKMTNFLKLNYKARYSIF